MAAAKEAKPLYSRFAEIGRVVLISYGPEAGKLATIVDIIDHNFALVDGPSILTGVKRHVLSFKWLSLTDLKVKVPLNARQSTLVAAWKEADIQAKWAASAWGKKLAARAAKKNMTDFDRFEAKVAKQTIAKKIGGGAKAKKAVKA